MKKVSVGITRVIPAGNYSTYRIFSSEELEVEDTVDTESLRREEMKKLIAFISEVEEELTQKEQEKRNIKECNDNDIDQILKSLENLEG